MYFYTLKLLKMDTNATPIDYHFRIKHLREMRNFTQEYLAHELKISQRAYSSIENGHTQLSVERLMDIARVLQVSIGDIIGSEHSNNYYNNFNNHSPNNKGNLIFQNDRFEEQRQLYERLLQSKEDEITLLRDLLSNKK